MIPSFLLTDNGISLFLNHKQHVVNKDHPNYPKILDAFRAGEYDKLEGLIDIASTAQRWVGNQSDFTITNGLVYYKGEPFTDAVSQKVLRLVKENLDATPLYNFLTKVRDNPSATAQRELLLFCEANHFLIHADGDIIAFKGVTNDYKDCHSHQFDNSIGKVVEMPRHQVDDRRDVTCSYGLHFGSKSQADGYGQRTMVVKVNPKDVVSIPSDYNNEKGRCCRYEVIDELEGRQPLEFKEVYGADDFGDDDEDEAYCACDERDCPDCNP